MVKKSTLRELRDQMVGEAYSLSYRLEPVYQTLEWEWAATTCGVPNQKAIFELFIYLIDRVIDNPGYTSSGGLFAEVYEDESGWYVGVVGFVIDRESYVKDM